MAATAINSQLPIDHCIFYFETTTEAHMLLITGTPPERKVYRCMAKCVQLIKVALHSFDNTNLCISLIIEYILIIQVSVYFDNTDLDITPPTPIATTAPLTAMTTPAVPTQQTQLTTGQTSNTTPPPATLTSPPVTSTSPQTMSTSQPPQSQSRMKSGELEANMVMLEESFNDLVDSVESSFIKTGVPLEKIQRSIKSIPVALKLQLGESFKREAARFLKAESITQIFFELSYFWDYLNPGLLRFLVNTFGSSDDKCSMKTYLQELSTFRHSVKIGDYIKASQADTNINNFIYTKMTMVMDQEWENKTLQDAQQFKSDVCNESHLPQSFTTRMCVQRSSVAIVFYLPRQYAWRI